ncbi:MAG: hypothetical protein RI936_1323 [Pseudomonadota bacterium]|jgi:hypothetical protein
MWSSTRSCAAEPRTRGLRHTRAAALALVLAALGPLVATPPALAREAAAATIPAEARQYLGEPRLSGSGRLTWFGLHVYDAALYLPPGVPLGALDDARFVLELRYARALEGRAIATASRDEMARMNLADAATLARWTEQMARLFPDVKRDQRLVGVNLPGRGVSFYFDGRPLGTIDDPAFARAFFAIWLDERTRAPQLRQALLAGKPARP